MNCHKFQKIFSAYIDGELTGETQAGVHQHLSQCRHCSRLVEAHRIGLTVLGKTDQLTPPDDLFEAVMSAVTIRPRQAFKWNSVFRPRVLVPVFSAALVALVFTFSPQFESSGGAIQPEFAVVDSTMDMINYQVAEQLAGKEESQKMKAVRLATYSGVEEESGKGGVNRNPVIVLSGISDYGE